MGRTPELKSRRDLQHRRHALHHFTPGKLKIIKNLEIMSLEKKLKNKNLEFICQY